MPALPMAKCRIPCEEGVHVDALRISYCLRCVESIDQPSKSPTLHPGSLAVKCLSVEGVPLPHPRLVVLRPVLQLQSISFNSQHLCQVDLGLVRPWIKYGHKIANLKLEILCFSARSCGYRHQRSICALECRARSNQRWHSLWLEKVLSLEPCLSTNDRGAVTAVPLCHRWDSLQTGALHMIALRTAIADEHVGVVITSLAHRARQILCHCTVVVHPLVSAFVVAHAPIAAEGICDFSQLRGKADRLGCGWLRPSSRRLI